MSEVRIRVFTESAELESLSSLWDGLLQKCGDEKSIYLTHEWVTTWWRHFGKDKRLNILLAEKDHQSVGIIPLMKTEYKIGFLSLHALETIGSVNCNLVWLVLPESRDEVMTAFLSYLEEELAKSKLVLRLTLVPDDSRFLDMLKGRVEPISKGLAVNVKFKTLAPFVSLPSTWEELYRSFSQNRRWVLRKKLRILEKEHSVEFQYYTPDDMLNRLSEFIELHQRRWQSVNVNGVFSNDGMKEFYKDIAIRFHEKNWLHFSFLNIDGAMASGEFGFIYNGKLYGGTAGRDIKYSKYSIGHLHYMFVIKDAISRGLREFDFLKGDEPYKFYWTKTARKYMSILIINKGIFPGLRLIQLSGFLRLWEIKQYSPIELYFLYLVIRRDKKERKRMGLKNVK